MRHPTHATMSTPQNTLCLDRREEPTPLDMTNISKVLENDDKVKVAGVDGDGILRGKIMSKDKFLSTLKTGFGFSSAVFGWDMHDQLYTTDAKIASPDSGYTDFLAIADLGSFRRISWEDNIPFFLLNFTVDGAPVSVCSRSMLRSLRTELSAAGYSALAGGKIPSTCPLYKRAFIDVE